MTSKPMRARSFTTLLRIEASAPKTRSHTLSLPATLRTTFFTPHRNLAQVKTGGEAFGSDNWFSGSGPARQTQEECGLQSNRPPSDERTVKLGKSMSPSVLVFIAPTCLPELYCNCDVLSLTTIPLSQLFAFFSPAFLHFSHHRFHQKSSLQT